MGGFYIFSKRAFGKRTTLNGKNEPASLVWKFMEEEQLDIRANGSKLEILRYLIQ